MVADGGSRSRKVRASSASSDYPAEARASRGVQWPCRSMSHQVLYRLVGELNQGLA